MNRPMTFRPQSLFRHVLWLSQLLWLAGLALPTLGFFAVGAHAHPFHTSSAEMEFNPNTGRYEVSLKLLASDLEEALTRSEFAKTSQAQKESRSGNAGGLPRGPVERVDLTRTADVDNRIVEYLKSRIALTADDKNSDDDDRAKIQSAHGFHWVGKELESSWVWLYFELDAPRNTDRIALRNAVFLELNSGQINICTLRADGSKYSLRTDAMCVIVTLPVTLPPSIR